MVYNMQITICEGAEVKYRTTLEGPLEDIDEAHTRVRHMKELTPGELVRIFEAAGNWNDLQTTVIQKSPDGKEWTALNVMNAIEAEKKFEDIMDLAPDLIAWVETGRDYIHSEGAESLPHEARYPEDQKEARLIREATEVLERFKEILGIPAPPKGQQSE